jgi:peptidoglycan/xylan/chitin deacetylase (PgdA/CDA1 family)
VRACRKLGAVLAAVAAVAGCGGSHPSGPSRSPRPSASATPTPTPRTDVASVAARAHIPVLCYHQIREPTSADSATDRTYIVRPSVFKSQMAALDRAGYTTVTGDQVLNHVARGAPLPHKPVLLTLDDASGGQWTSAYPVLRRHHFKATFFIMTVVLGKPGWLTRGQVRALDRAGMTIGSHTWDHKAVPQYTGTDWQTEINAPTHDLERLVGHRVRLFAYPFGLYDREAIPHLLRAGLRAAFQLADRPDPRHPLWTLRRIIVPEVGGAQLLREMKQDF